MPTGKLTTHVLDTAHGCPAAGMAITLTRLVDNQPEQLANFTTNADGRLDGPALQGDAFQPGLYQLTFAVADYFASRKHPDAGRFLATVPLVFNIEDTNQHYHVPLLVSPWSYSTYRGS
ncbi:MAG: hydroxyisourate hydrolase [Planctomycetota bacterium]